MMLLLFTFVRFNITKISAIILNIIHKGYMVVLLTAVKDEFDSLCVSELPYLHVQTDSSDIIFACSCASNIMHIVKYELNLD